MQKDFPNQPSGNSMHCRRNTINGNPAPFIDFVHQYQIHEIPKIVLIGKRLIEIGDVGVSVQHFCEEEQSDGKKDLF